MASKDSGTDARHNPPHDGPPLRAGTSFVLGLALALLALAAFGPALRNGFVNWDDGPYIVINRVLDDRAHGLGRIWFEPRAAPIYYPLVFTTFWVERQLDMHRYGEEHAWTRSWLNWNHVFNILLHGLAGVLLWRCLLRLGMPAAAAWATAAIWIVHPMQVESVAWAVERKNTLAGLFYFATALMWLRADGKALRPSYFAALAMFALMMLSKTAFVGLVLTLPLLEWLRGRRLSSGAIVRTAPFLVLGVLQLWLWNRMGGELMTVDPPPPLARPVIAGQALWFYLYKMLWPVGLTTIYPRWDTAVTMIRTIPLALALAGGVAWLIAAFRTSPRRSLLAAAILVGTFQYVVTVGPALGLVPWPHTDVSFVANHFAYVGLAGPIALIVLGARALWRRSRRPSEPLIPAAAVALIVVLLGAVSYWRTRAWYDAPTLANDVLRVNPGCAEALALLSMEAKSEGRPDEAIEKMRQALARKPRYPQALIEYARLLDQYRGQTAEAIEHAGRAAELQPDVANAYWLTAELLEKAGRNAEAVEWADRTLRFPEATPAVVLTLKVRCLRRLGRFEEALAAARSMPQSEPRAQANREQLVAEALIDMGRHEEAIRVLTGLIQRFGPAPASPGARRFAAGAHLVRARALLSLNHPDQAESDLQRAVQLDPSLEPEARRLREAPGP